MTLSRKSRSGGIKRLFANLLIVLLIGCGGVGFFLFFETGKPTIDSNSVPKFLGNSNTIKLKVADAGSGLRQVTVTARQGEKTVELYTSAYPRSGYTGQIGPAAQEIAAKFDTREQGFTEGPVQIVASARDYSMMGFFKGNQATAVIESTIDSKPPVVRLLHSEQYIAPGGSGIAIYSVDDPESRHGVVINGHFNAGHPVAGAAAGTFIAFFALPFDAEKLNESHVIATDIAGNGAMLPFSPTFQAVQQKHDRINISDGFLSSKIPEFEQHYPAMSGSLIDKYLYTNQAIRDENNRKIEEICSSSAGERKWQGRFQRMAGSGRAGFADHRTYYYNDQPIDKQVHLGIDIASTQQANVTAANSGTVVFADYLGIYGNMVIIDHGQGVFSLYSHLSQINAKVGSAVTSNDSIGLTGTTGMAGGDHLHFSMLINGIFVTPIEWWDPHWIAVTIDKPLAKVIGK